MANRESQGWKNEECHGDEMRGKQFGYSDASACCSKSTWSINKPTLWVATMKCKLIAAQQMWIKSMEFFKYHCSLQYDGIVCREAEGSYCSTGR